jgi:DNA-binding beta-propeller fold protein YncE
MRRYSVKLAGTLLAPAVGIVLAAGGTLAASTAPTFFEQEGLRVEVEVSPLDAAARTDAGLQPAESVRLRFRVREAGEAGKPVSGLFPLAWLVGRQADEGRPDRKACEYQIRSLLAGRLARVADVNLNEYLLVTLDDNNSVSIIDPQIESSKTKTVGLVSLTAKGEDFVLAPDRRRVLVTLPAQGRVAEADMFTRKARYVDVGGTPRRIALQPDGRLAWIGQTTGDSVAAVTVADLTRAGSVTVGPGPHEFAFRDDSRRAFVGSPASERLAVIDTHTLTPVGEVEIGAGLVALSYSAHSGQAYAALEDGTLVAVDGTRLVRTTSIALPPGVSDFDVSRDGRWGIALHGDADRVSIIDLATNRPVHEAASARAPDHVAFTDSFAYVSHAGSSDFVLVDLKTLDAEGPPGLATVVMGQQPPAAGAHATIAPTIAPLPEGGGALVLNGPDRSVYHFMEGMNAPMGAYGTYPWPARGLLVVDRTIREVEQGLYQTEFQAPGAGVYTVPFLVPTSPQLWGCFDLVVERAPGQRVAGASLKVEPLFDGEPLAAGRPQDLAVRLLDRESGRPVDGLDDVMLLVLRGPTWQWRGAARGLGKGRYAVTVTFPDAGQYMVMIASPSRGVEFGALPSGVARVAGPAGDVESIEETGR